jgi:hypothetical protein
MKLGIIFKKEYQEEYGHKQEFFGDEITIKRDLDMFVVHNITTKENTININIFPVNININIFPVNTIQLIYLGEWK